MRPSESNPVRSHIDWAAWLILSWLVAVLVLYSTRMIEARPESVASVLRLLGLS